MPKLYGISETKLARVSMLVREEISSLSKKVAELLRDWLQELTEEKNSPP